MSVEKVRAYLAQWGKDSGVMEFDVSSATVELAAQAVGVIPARIAKTLSFQGEDGCILVVTAGDMKISNSKYKAQFGRKAKMLSAEEALSCTGHAVGGVCPFALPETGVTVYTDVSMRRFETVFPACGSASSAIELTPDELYQYGRSAAWVDVCQEK